MHHARGVDRAQAFRQPRGQCEHRPRRQRPVVVDRLGQRGPGNVDVASHATGPSTSASTTMAVNTPFTLPRRGDLPPEPSNAALGWIVYGLCLMPSTPPGGAITGDGWLRSGDIGIPRRRRVPVRLRTGSRKTTITGG